MAQSNLQNTKWRNYLHLIKESAFLLNHDNLLKEIVKLESNVNMLIQEMTEPRSLAIQLIEENVTLQAESDNLKALIAKSEQNVESAKASNESPHNKELNENDFKSAIKNVKKSLPNKDNSAVLYSESFHICDDELLGKHCYDEDCLLCMNTLDS